MSLKRPKINDLHIIPTTGNECQEFKIQDSDTEAVVLKDLNIFEESSPPQFLSKQFDPSTAQPKATEAVSNLGHQSGTGLPPTKSQGTKVLLFLNPFDKIV